MIADKKEFGFGLMLFIGFWLVFAIAMSPVISGRNVLDYMDNLYNSISKTSAYYIPAVQEQAEAFRGRQVAINVKTDSAMQAARTSRLFEAGRADVKVEGQDVRVEGDLGLMLDNILNDADLMFANNGEAIAGKYGYEGRVALYDWWHAIKSAEKDLNKQKLFKEAKIIHTAQTRAVEPAYNYYGIKAEHINAKLITVIISLVGYVVYTLWYGFSILFMFEGWGLKLEH